MADPTDDEIERIRALLATNDGAVPFDVARTLLAALDAKSAEAERLRRRIESAPPWVSDGEPLSDEQMRALKLRWSTGPERYQADADALIATVLHERAEVERHLRTAEETVLAALLDGPGATEDA